MSTILVTGRNGFIANAIVEAFKRDHKIISLVRSRKTHLNYDNEEIFIADLLSLPGEQLGAYGIDLIIHAAAMIQGHPDSIERENIRTAQNVFQIAERLGVPVIFLSSTNALFAEQLGGYARSKRTAEEMLKASRLKYLILRVPFVLDEDSSTVKTIKSFAAKYPILPLLGPQRGMTHVISLYTIIDFLKERIVRSAFAPESINLLSRQTYTYPQIIENILKRKVRFAVVPYRLSLAICQLMETLKLPFPVTSEQVKSFNMDKIITGDQQGRTIFIDEDLKALFG